MDCDGTAMIDRHSTVAVYQRQSWILVAIHFIDGFVGTLPRSPNLLFDRHAESIAVHPAADRCHEFGRVESGGGGRVRLRYCSFDCAHTRVNPIPNFQIASRFLGSGESLTSSSEFPWRPRACWC
jgi:hypothetical protein